MTAKAAGEIALKVWSVILVVSAVLSIPALLGQVTTKGESPIEAATWHIAAVWNSVHAALTIIVALVLYKFASEISSRFNVPDGQSDSPLTSASLASVGFGILGAYFLVLAIRQFADLLFQLATKPAYEQQSLSYLWGNQLRALVGATVQLVAGLVLLVGRNALSKAWAHLRARGEVVSEPVE